MKDQRVDEKALQLDEKRKETLEFFDVATKDWHKLGVTKQNEVENRIKFDARYLKPEQLKLIKQAFVDESILTEKAFDELIKQGYFADGITPPETKRYSVDAVNQATLDKLLEKAIPKEGFIKDYLDAFSEVTDTPKVFLFWGALVVIAAVLGKNAYVLWETRKLYPNIWCVFIAPSGFRKGTAIDIPRDLLERVDETLLLPQVASEEGLFKALDRDTGKDVGFVRWQEFSKILRAWSNKQSWQASQEFWIDIWDGKKVSKKLSGAEFNIPKTSISFLSASTPKTFSAYFEEADLEGGFFGRIYLITCTEKKKYFPIPPPIEEGILNPLIKKLHDIKENYKEEALSLSEIEEGFSHWAKETQGKHEKGYLDSFYSRLETHVMKLAIIFEAATTGKAHITQQSLTYAINAFEFLLASAYPLISEEIGLSEAEKRVYKIAKYIQERAEVDKSEIMKNLHLDAFSMENIEKTLIERELIEVRQEKPAGRGRSKKIYFWSSNSFGYE